MVAGRPTKYEGEETLKKVKKYLEGCVDSYEEIPVQNMVTEKSGGITAKTTEEKKTTRYRLKVALPTIEGLCEALGVSKQTVYDWEKVETEFLDSTNMLREKQAQKLQQNAISGDYNPMIAKVLLSQHGYSERIINDNNNKNEEVTDNQEDILNSISE